MIVKFLFVCGAILLLAGCEADPDSRDFFYSGWVDPQKGSDERMYGKTGPRPREGSEFVHPEDKFPDQLPTGN